MKRDLRYFHLSSINVRLPIKIIEQIEETAIQFETSKVEVFNRMLEIILQEERYFVSIYNRLCYLRNKNIKCPRYKDETDLLAVRVECKLIEKLCSLDGILDRDMGGSTTLIEMMRTVYKHPDWWENVIDKAEDSLMGEI